MALGYGIAAVAPDDLRSPCPRSSWPSLGNGAAVVCNALLVQRGAPDELRGRAFTVIMCSNYALLGLGMVVAGALTDAFGARWVWGGAAASAYRRRARCAALVLAPSRASRGASREPAAAPGRSTTLAAGVRAGDRRALARAISLVENGDPLSYDARPRALPGDRLGLRRRRHRPAGGRQVVPDQRARPPRPRPRSGRSA